ncbi:Phage repressor protein C, contains Cro/C1-type HTH and peptisase s24 domains [Devosia lucknowensis]|uniref:Phage repressor protein C, contains Cro/C1-type HTH and peptisase s24 domains n=1 Tax=Devosia lucknowensis TaxID=1096929 RepID=A0A1Y6E5X8_9HYPH|nr:helix-turn-helix transcriptional regulator [Devosia lucknowensis]SMQ58148.1 Phage repressor protein C, contains Cro/C1-type HTH and peptisase s24 domains [Devosia lucknowensis]
MLSHRAIWDGIDGLARRQGVSVSALAKLAGLDATAFNVSKRVSKDGRERWPSTESIAKILEATNESFDSFLSGTGAFLSVHSGFAESDLRNIPLLGLAQAGSGGFFDSAGFPVGHGWDEVALPTPDDNGIYALEISGDSMEPLYREGDRIVVSPTEQVRRGDRVVVKTRDGEVMAKILARQSAKQIELHSINPAYEPRILDIVDVEWMARIIWASQ